MMEHSSQASCKLLTAPCELGDVPVPTRVALPGNIVHPNPQETQPSPTALMGGYRLM